MPPKSPTRPQSSTHDVEDLKAADAKDVHRAVREEGEGELSRPFASLFWSGLAAGLAINASLVSEAALHARLPDTLWRELVTGLGYPLGFVLVILGRMQFFTESTITAMLPLVTRPSRWALGRTLRLWGIVLSANLIGTALAAAALAAGWIGGDQLSEAALAVAAAVTAPGPGETFISAIPAGFLIAVLAWSLPNARPQAFFVIFAVTYIVGIAGFSHSIVGSSEAFLLWFSGQIGGGQALLGVITPAVLGNLVGGAGLFAILAHAQVRGEMTEEADEG